MPESSKLPKPSTRFLKRYIIEPDGNDFVGRVYDLSIVDLHFETWAEIERYPDCLYVLSVNEILSNLVRRMESLNMAGDMLWPELDFIRNFDLPISRFDWLNVSADTFLMRIVSVYDCALLLTNEVYETQLKPRECNLSALERNGVPLPIIELLRKVAHDGENLRYERNLRAHRGVERPLSSDDTTFKFAGHMEKNNGRGVKGTDQHGRRINTQRYLKEGLVYLQREFNKSGRVLVKNINQLFELLNDEFDPRFSAKFNDPISGYGAKSRKS